MKDEKEVDGIYPGIPSGPLDPGWLRRGDDFPARYSSEPSQSMEVETPDPAQDVEPDDTEGDPEDQPQEPDGNEQETDSSAPGSGHELEPAETTFTLSAVPTYSGSAYVAVNGNVPTSRLTTSPLHLLKATAPWTLWGAAVSPMPV